MTDTSEQTTNETRQNHWPDWRSAVHAKEGGPDLVLLHQSDTLKTVLVALGAGQMLPPHKGAAASFHVLDGTGTILVGEEDVEVSPGSTVVIDDGLTRSVRATTALTFLGNLGDPASEED